MGILEYMKSSTGEISYAVLEDIPVWMDFVLQMIDGFPGFYEGQHRERLKVYIKYKQVLVMRDGNAIIGAAAFSLRDGSSDFFEVHPQLWRLPGHQSCGWPGNDGCDGRFISASNEPNEGVAK